VLDLRSEFTRGLGFFATGYEDPHGDQYHRSRSYRIKSVEGLGTTDSHTIGPMNGSLTFAILYVLFWLGVMGILYQRRIFIKL
jgi:hypothetical protein